MRAIRIVLRRGSLRAAKELTGSNDETIAGWIRRIGEHAAAVTEGLVRDRALSEVEVDEFWPFVGKKGGRGAQAGSSDPPEGEKGEQWGCLSEDRTSRFVGAWASGPREEALVREVVATTRRRTKGRVGIPYVSDGWESSATTIKETDRDAEPARVNPNWKILRPTEGMALIQAVKHRQGRRLERVEVRAVFGAPADLPDAVPLERLNGTLRDRLGCLTRKTPGFAKASATWDALLGLSLFAHTWLRPHLALRCPLAVPTAGRCDARRSPAIVLGLTDHPWTWEEFLCWSVRRQR